MVIIGAGTAGLSAANHLLQTGLVDVCVLEGSDRVGGRVHTSEIGNHIVELGAAWIHGTVGNPIYHFASKNNLLHEQEQESPLCSDDFNTESVSLFFASGNYSIDNKMVEEVSEIYSCLMEDADDTAKMKEIVQQSNESKPSVGSYIQERFQQYLNNSCANDDPHSKYLKKKIFQWFEESECNYSGCSTLHDLNLEDFGEYQELEGSLTCSVVAGYDRIPQLLAANVGENSIYFGHTVNRIQWRNKVLKNKEAVSCPVQVICENGKYFDADHVIVTVPLGVLKLSHTTLFHPSLPHEKVQAIENLGFGICDKVFLEFEKPFWSGAEYRVNLVWTETYEENGASECPYPSWVYALYCFHTVSPGSNILLAWVHGDAATEVEQTTPDEVGKYCLDVLGQFTGIKSFPKLVSVRRTQWSANPFSRGSYSYVARETRASDIDVLASPLPCKEAVVDNGLPPLQVLFAGEATHRHFYSTVHGAYISGIREAHRIVKSKSHEQ